MEILKNKFTKKSEQKQILILKLNIMARNISKIAIQKFLKANKFKNSNTEVEVKPNVSILKIFGNPIAYQYNAPERTLLITNCGYKTNVTKDRLNSIPGVQIRQIKHQWYLNGKEWDGELIDIK